jgi:cell division septation protein DedD/nucleoid DNA-binding protein
MVEEHIKQLLRDHDCVIIPDFGGLITHYASARIHPVKHTMVPPSRRVAFNEKLKHNDGLLISTIVHQNQLSPESARTKVADFVKGMQEELRAKFKYEMRGIGLFRLNAEQRIEFEYIETENLLDESFGLPELVSRPVLAAPPVNMRNLFKDQPAASPVAGKKSNRSRIARFYKVAAALVVGSLTFSGLYYLSSQTDSTLSSLNPVPFFMPEADRPATAETEAGPVAAPYGHQHTPEEIREMYRELYPSGLTDELLASKYAAEAMAGIDDWDAYVDSLEDLAQEEITSPELGWEDPEPAPSVQPAEPVAKKEARAVPKAAKAEVKAQTGAKPKIVKEVSAPKTSAPAKEEAAAVIRAETGRFYVISGGYSTLENAQKSRAALKKQGRDAKIILPAKGSKLHRVSVADFSSRDAAINALNALKPKYGTSIWVLNY